jgi:hypothetical protein
MKVPQASIHLDTDGLMVELHGSVRSLTRCKYFLGANGLPIGWCISEPYMENRYFWPGSSPYNLSYAIACRATGNNRHLMHWKRDFFIGMLASRICKLIRQTMALMDPKSLDVCSQISKHIKMSEWKWRCYHASCGMAVHAIVERDLPIRPSLVLSPILSHVDGTPVWDLGHGCAEETPKDALAYHYGDVGIIIYDAIVGSSSQLKVVNLFDAPNAFGFNTCPKDKRDAETLAFAFVHGMHPCRCCIGSDLEAFCRKVREYTSSLPTKGKSGAVYNLEVCVKSSHLSNKKKENTITYL